MGLKEARGKHVRCALLLRNHIGNAATPYRDGARPEDASEKTEAD
jgi:hypothetical protein